MRHQQLAYAIKSCHRKLAGLLKVVERYDQSSSNLYYLTDYNLYLRTFLIERSLCWFTSNYILIEMRLSSDITVKPITLTDVRWLYMLGFYPCGIYKPIFCYFYNSFLQLINLHPFYLTIYITHHPHFFHWKCVGSSAVDLSRHISQQKSSLVRFVLRLGLTPPVSFMFRGSALSSLPIFNFFHTDVCGLVCSQH